MSMSTGYVHMHIYIEDMRTKKALSEHVPDDKEFLLLSMISINAQK